MKQEDPEQKLWASKYLQPGPSNSTGFFFFFFHMLKV